MKDVQEKHLENVRIVAQAEECFTNLEIILSNIKQTGHLKVLGKFRKKTLERFVVITRWHIPLMFVPPKYNILKMF